MSVRLYGNSLGYGSRAQVTRGFQHVLEQQGLLAGFVALDQPPTEPPPPGATARAALLTGAPELVEEFRRNALHDRRFVLLAPNSDSIPLHLVDRLERLATDILAPSQWAEKIIRKECDLAIHYAPHGVDPGFQPRAEHQQMARKAYEMGYFAVGHFASTSKQRKGTRELLTAWRLCIERGTLPKLATLLLFLPVEHQLDLHPLLAPKSTMLAPLELPPERMAFAYQSLHLVCQPSRGEGFGCVPLEALCSGVPIVATDCTGHGDWMRPLPAGAVLVETGPLAPIDDGPRALAPSLDPEAIAQALGRAYAEWPKLSEAALTAATALGRRWSWTTVLEGVLPLFRG